VAHQTASPGTPQANLHLAQGVGTAPRKSPPRSSAWRPFNVSPPRLRALAPRTSFRLARGFRPLEQASASLEASLDPRHPSCAPDQGIKCTEASQAPGSKMNPRHADLLTWPGNQISALFEQPVTVQPSRCCASAMRDGRCHSVALHCPLPSFFLATPLEKGQRRHRRAYGHRFSIHLGRRHDVRRTRHISSVTSDPVRPFPVLCHHPGYCGAIPYTMRA
jgi:hypothetical protein